MCALFSSVENLCGGEAHPVPGKHCNGPTKTITVAHQLHLWWLP
jgi:hypothetical protein